MGRGIAGAILKVLRARDFKCEVTKVWEHTSTMRGFRFYARELIETVHPEEGEYLRCWFPDLIKENKLNMRGYTMVDIDYASHEFTMYFLMHSPLGPGSSWAKNAKVGDSFEASYYGSTPFKLPAEPPNGYVFLADAAGIPYINATIALIPSSIPVKLWMLSWNEEDKEIPIIKQQNLEITWLTPNLNTVLEHAKKFNWDGWNADLICEARILLPIKRYLIKEAGVGKERMHVHAYWIKGKEMGSSKQKNPSTKN
ncbi:siderophore-interacting protein [Actinomycetaceae bacterium TAE3-ERU4]|nr:siderophore-interacting protein [Actinomycetaceae bacterium TAE3-ERU4]